MKLYPDTVEEKLGFTHLRQRLDALTRSRLGQERLERMQPGRRLDWVRAELERVDELRQALRFDDPVPLDDVVDVRETLRRAGPEGASVAPEELEVLRRVLATLRRLHAYLEVRRSKYPHLHEAAARIVPLPELEARLARVVDEEGRVRDDASPELRRLRALIVRRQSQLRDTLLGELRRAIAQGYATEEQPTVRGGRMVIPIRAEAKRKVPGFIQDTSATGQTVYLEPAAVLDLNNEVRELEGAERREVERLLREAAAAVRAHLPALHDGVSALAQFDLLQAKAHLALELDATLPQLNDAGVLDIRDGRNPVLLLHFRRQREAGGAERQVVPLRLTLGEAYHTLVITGPNAGGKTVAMKTAGLFVLMVSYGLLVPADPLSTFPLFEQLIVDIGDEQSIEEDLSTFSSHVANLKHMLRTATARTFILMDEAGTGTDPAEGGALAQAVLERLTALGARTIATTHHGTLKVFAHETDGVENGSMAFDPATLSPTYQFRAGVPGSSYAFDIAQRIGLQRDVLERARALVGTQKTAMEELILTFEARNRALAEALRAAEQARAEAERARRQYDERAALLREEREARRREALAEAERIVQEANARVERTIREIKEAQAAREATRVAREALDAFRDDVASQRQKAERKAARPARRPAARPAPAASSAAPRALGVGDQVVLDGGTAPAEVLELSGREALIAFGSMKTRVDVQRLTKVGGPRPQQVTVRQVATGAAELAAVRARTSVDLRGLRVDEALAEVARLVDGAVAAGLERVEVLHGKGTGALRQAIHEYLAAQPEVASFEEAPPDQGGAGVTLVALR